MNNETNFGSRAPANGSPYRLLITDIDGTLLDSTSTLRPANIAAIQAARQAGIAVTIATGRRYATTVEILRLLDLLPTTGEVTDRAPLSALVMAPPVVLQGGAVVVSADGAEVFFRNPLPRADALRAARIVIELGLQPIVYDDQIHRQRLFTGPDHFDNPPTATYLSRHPHIVERQHYDLWDLNHDPLQLAVIGPLEPLNLAASRLTFPGCRVIISYSPNLDAHFLEVFHRQCDKAAGAEQVAGLLGLSLAETVCIGDNWNDVEMLARAGCGVAVSNAPPEVLPFARRLSLSNDEDAVSVVLSQLLAGEEPGIPNPHYDPALIERYFANVGCPAD